MKDKFFSLIARLRHIDRWSLMRNTRKENVAEHSYITAVVAHALCIIENELFGGELNPEKAAIFALYHDSAEVFTGDLPTPVKYHSEEIRAAYKAIEEKAEKKLLEFLPNELKDAFAKTVSPEKSEPEYKFVKYADKLAALIKCNEELSAGNAEFAAAKKSIEKTLESIPEKSVKYFLQNFADSFGLSLDETL
ncbi:MAG: 5'-deoxynucleotidase [Clostridia bacterium]|uniref:5'-deoxynucleotidase n=1 Tax=Pumilibacter muris TaxID=2941510 RepID=UPI00203E1E53|nr:5'-deoxynucleotidase [Pumilibacter muris]MCI8596348.1 5'-deoxynucleotidase [Clostridia bacterium]